MICLRRSRHTGARSSRDDLAKRLRVARSQIQQNQATSLQLDLLADTLAGMLYRYQRLPDGSTRFLYISQGARHVFGLSPEALYEDDQRMFAMIHPDDIQAVREVIDETMRQPVDIPIDFRIQTPDRGERWVRGHARAQPMPDGSFIWHGYNQDITQLKRQALRAKDSETLVERVLTDMPLPLVLVNDEGEFYFRNKRFNHTFGFPKEVPLALGKWWDMMYPDPLYREEAQKHWHNAIEQAPQHHGEIVRKHYRLTMRDGSERIMSIGGLAFDGYAMATFEDHTEQQQQREHLQQMAYIDGLTGIPNRRRFDETLQIEWRRCQRSERPLSILMLDIDDFKAYNDHYGHLAGDKCLQVVAATLHANANRGQDLVARYGGEEFVCLLPECHAQGALQKAEQLMQAILALQIPHTPSSVHSVLTVSMGVATIIPHPEQTAEHLLAHADANLYRAKQNGRNRVVANA